MNCVRIFLGLLIAMLWAAQPIPAEAEAYAPFPAETWVYQIEFRRFPEPPQCKEKDGRGRVVKSERYGNVVYTVTGFPAARVLRCSLSNGETFDMDAWYMFDLDDSFWKGPVEILKRGETQKVHARTKYRRMARGVETVYTFHTVTGVHEERSYDRDIYHALHPERKHLVTTGRWKD